MRELNIEQRLIRIEEDITLIKKMLARILNKPVGSTQADDANEVLTVKQVAEYLAR